MKISVQIMFLMFVFGVYKSSAQNVQNLDNEAKYLPVGEEGGTVAIGENTLPEVRYIFNLGRNINFKDAALELKDNQVVSVNKVSLSDVASVIVTNKLNFLDSAQYYYAEKYSASVNDLAEARYHKKRHSNVMKILATSVKDIAKIVNNQKSSVSVENRLKNMRAPNIDPIPYPIINKEVIAVVKD